MSEVNANNQPPTIEDERDVPSVHHEACANCAFWSVWWGREDEAGSPSDIEGAVSYYGYCQRYPPTYNPGRHKGEDVMDDDADEFPSTDSKEWCGEYRAALPGEE